MTPAEKNMACHRACNLFLTPQLLAATRGSRGAIAAIIKGSATVAAIVN